MRTISSRLPKTVGRVEERETTPGLYALRAIQCGLTIADLKILSVGMVKDIMIERANDNYEYPVLANQDDMDRL